MTGLLHALLHTKGEAVFQCDNKGVFNTFLKGPLAQPRYNGILWNLIFRAAKNRYELGHGNIQVEWIKSHLSADVAAVQGLCPGKWLANAISDILADTAAGHFQMSEQQLQLLKTHSEQSVRMLKHLVAIAVMLAPAARAASRISSGASQSNDKRQILDLLAKRSGHAFCNMQCTKCRLQLDISRNIAYCEAVLELPCIVDNNSASYQLVNLPKAVDDAYLFHKLLVHNSHSAAAHFGLKIKFCTRCGCYGQPAGKSVGLARPCVAPTRQGRQALNNVLRGKWPAYIGKDIVDKVPKILSAIMDKILLE